MQKRKSSKKRIENKDKPAVSKKYDSDLEKNQSEFQVLYERKTNLKKDEYETIRKKLLVIRLTHISNHIVP